MRAAASLHAAEAALRGAQARPEPSDGPGRPRGSPSSGGADGMFSTAEGPLHRHVELVASSLDACRFESGEDPRLWGGLRRAPEATASLQTAQAALRGA